MPHAQPQGYREWTPRGSAASKLARGATILIPVRKQKDKVDPKGKAPPAGAFARATERKPLPLPLPPGLQAKSKPEKPKVQPKAPPAGAKDPMAKAPPAEATRKPLPLPHGLQAKSKPAKPNAQRVQKRSWDVAS